ncbi:hypothetical protein L21SP2_2545 [Salinispira pacifica]|uniref:HTH cro/C1-type domain-containing protein n=2 Tax=Salinispira pacifica TaxID=1307761 RepID=V5WJ89_9SPIO|nr:hypothetical protein L21SP2_2545 [Salinispira pacifica]
MEFMDQFISGDNLKLILGLKIKHYRQQQGLSLQRLARRSGLALSYISEIESGKKYPKPEKLIQLARALNISYDELVSARVQEDLDPLANLMNSPLIREFPFELFGVSTRDILQLFGNKPENAQAFLSTFIQIGQAYDMSLENFLFAALRTYQTRQNNYFPEQEAQAEIYRDSLKEASEELGGEGREAPGSQVLVKLLQGMHGYELDTHTLSRNPELEKFRSVYREGPVPRLYLNARLLESQKRFILLRELAFLNLELKIRPFTSSWIQVASFDQLVNNFIASYFAGAVLLPRSRMSEYIRSMQNRSSWSPELLLEPLEREDVTPEMFLYRMSQILPGLHDLSKIFYLRFTGKRDGDRVHLTKELNMTDDMIPYGLHLHEHFCRRWLPLRLMNQIREEGPGEPGELPRAGAQRVRFLDGDREYLLLSVARPLSLEDGKLSVMTLGIQLDGEQRDFFPFALDPSIPDELVHETCERCPLSSGECSLRAAPPGIRHLQDALQRKEKAISGLLRRDQPR